VISVCHVAGKGVHRKRGRDRLRSSGKSDLLGWARDDAEIIYAGKQPGESRTQQEITSLLDRQSTRRKAGRSVKRRRSIRLGRGAEEAEEIAGAGIPFEIVPGITRLSPDRPTQASQ
jgi:Uroporphyrinogen-III methylase